MKSPKQIRTWFYVLISLVSLLPLAGCETMEDRHRWRHKEWREGDRGHWHDYEEMRERR